MKKINDITKNKRRFNINNNDIKIKSKKISSEISSSYLEGYIQPNGTQKEQDKV